MQGDPCCYLRNVDTTFSGDPSSSNGSSGEFPIETTEERAVEENLFPVAENEADGPLPLVQDRCDLGRQRLRIFDGHEQSHEARGKAGVNPVDEKGRWLDAP